MMVEEEPSNSIECEYYATKRLAKSFSTSSDTVINDSHHISELQDVGLRNKTCKVS